MVEILTQKNYSPGYQNLPGKFRPEKHEFMIQNGFKVCKLCGLCVEQDIELSNTSNYQFESKNNQIIKTHQPMIPGISTEIGNKKERMKPEYHRYTRLNKINGNNSRQIRKIRACKAIIYRYKAHVPQIVFDQAWALLLKIAPLKLRGRYSTYEQQVLISLKLSCKLNNCERTFNDLLKISNDKINEITYTKVKIRIKIRCLK